MITVAWDNEIFDYPSAGYTIYASQINGIVDEIKNNRATNASPTFTGIPLAPTAEVGENSDQIATCSFVALSAMGYFEQVDGGGASTSFTNIIDGGDGYTAFNAPILNCGSI